MLTRKQVEAHIQCLLNCYPDGCRYEEQRDAWVSRILAHDAALRAKVEELEQEKAAEAALKLAPITSYVEEQEPWVKQFK